MKIKTITATVEGGTGVDRPVKTVLKLIHVSNCETVIEFVHGADGAIDARTLALTLRDLAISLAWVCVSENPNLPASLPR